MITADFMEIEKMTKEEFKELFKESFSLDLDTCWNAKTTDWCLIVKLIDNDTGNVFMQGEMPAYRLTE